MAAGSTYTPLATTTISGTPASYTFSSIPATYTDLVLVAFGGAVVGNVLEVTFNSDTGTNYSETVVYGNGTSALSARTTSNNWISLIGKNIGTSGNVYDNGIMSLMNYANSTTYKTVMSRQNVGGAGTVGSVGLWRNTAAITSITVAPNPGGGNLITGSTFTLYGIAAA